MSSQAITLNKFIPATPDRVYRAFLDPADLVGWYQASPDWTTPWARVDAVPGGKLAIRFEDPAGKHSFDLEGVFTEFIPDRLIDYTMTDGRRVRIELEPVEGGTRITETFDAEEVNNPELQRQGWMGLLDHLETYLAGEGDPGNRTGQHRD